MTPRPEALEERRAEIARLAQAWVDAEVVRASMFMPTVKDDERVRNAKVALLSELSRLTEALAAREADTAIVKAAINLTKMYDRLEIGVVNNNAVAMAIAALREKVAALTVGDRDKGVEP